MTSREYADADESQDRPTIDDDSQLLELQRLADAIEPPGSLNVEYRTIYEGNSDVSSLGYVVFQKHEDGTVDILGRMGEFELVRYDLVEWRDWSEKCKRMRAAATAAGHDPYPSFLYGFRGADGVEPDPATDYGPSDCRGYGDPPYNTCDSTCRACEALRQGRP